MRKLKFNYFTVFCFYFHIDTSADIINPSRAREKAAAKCFRKNTILGIYKGYILGVLLACKW